MHSLQLLRVIKYLFLYSFLLNLTQDMWIVILFFYYIWRTFYYPKFARTLVRVTVVLTIIICSWSIFVLRWVIGCRLRMCNLWATSLKLLMLAKRSFICRFKNPLSSFILIIWRMHIWVRKDNRSFVLRGKVAALDLVMNRDINIVINFNRLIWLLIELLWCIIIRRLK